MVKNTSLQEYLNQIKLLIPIRTRSTKMFISELSTRVNDYLDENPSASVDEITVQFGTPMEISQSYLNSIDFELLIKQLSLARLMRHLLVMVTIFLIAALCIFYAFTYKAYLHYKDTVITETETVISDSRDYNLT